MTEEKSNLYDVIVVGTGPAGLTAALYTSRRTLKTLVIGKDLGGQTSMTTEIENYPGIETVDGFTLSQTMQKQAKNFGSEILTGEVAKVKKLENKFEVVTASKKIYYTKSVILANGLIPQSLDVPGEDDLAGKGVSYCATCDSPLFRDKIVAVVGGGNSALDAADLLSRFATKVYLIHRRDEFRGEEIIVNKVKNTKNIEIIFNSKVTEISGDKFVEGIKLINNEGKESQLEVGGVFVEIGRKTKTDFLKGFIDLNGRGQIKISRDCETSEPGIFAAGDVTDVRFKQIGIAVGEGTKAALKAYGYIAENEGRAFIPDWGTKAKK